VFQNAELKKTFGARTYTVEYAYDGQGRMTNMLAWSRHKGTGLLFIDTHVEFRQIMEGHYAITNAFERRESHIRGSVPHE